MDRKDGRRIGSGTHSGGRGPRGAAPGGQGGAEALVLAALKDLERPLTVGDLDAQRAPLAKILERLKPLRLPGIEGLAFDCRTKLFTALLRAGRQPPLEADAEKEAKRREVMGVLGDIWRALGDERRAALCFAAAGRSEPALKMLKLAGEWEEVAELHAREARPLEAARLYEQHGEFGKAMHAFAAAADARGVLRAALHAGDFARAMAAAKEVPLKTARELLLKSGQGDLLLDLLASQGRWSEVGELYERAEQWPDAARAYERARRFSRAIVAFDRAGDDESAARCLAVEVESHAARGDTLGAAEVLRRHGRHEKAAERVKESRPDLAFNWLLEGGHDAEALALGQRRARLAAEAGKHEESAEWLERLGDLPAAAEAFLRADRPARALSVYEQLGNWEAAGEAAVCAGQKDRALEFFQRAKVDDPEGRAGR
jgi:tetratricopeptide (TPR) repeat protein